MGACACMGPPGNCPCMRTARGEIVPIKQAYISDEVFDCLSEEDKLVLEDLKIKALGLYLDKVFRA